MWGGMFSTFDCAIKGIRKKEDPYNASMCTLFSRFTGHLGCPVSGERLTNRFSLLQLSLVSSLVVLWLSVVV